MSIYMYGASDDLLIVDAPDGTRIDNIRKVQRPNRTP